MRFNAKQRVHVPAGIINYITRSRTTRGKRGKALHLYGRSEVSDKINPAL